MIQGFGKALDLAKNIMGFSNKVLIGYQNLKDKNLLKIINTSLENLKPVIVLYFDITKFHEIEQINGRQAAARVLTMFNGAIKQKIPELFWNAKMLAVENLLGDDFVVLLGMEQETDLLTMQDIAIASRIGIKESLKQEMLKITGEPLEVHVGYAIISFKSENLDSQLYNAVREARDIARGSIDLQTARLQSEFRILLSSLQFNIVYQPIVSFRSGGILGWEALTRGPRDSYFRNPDIIFSFAEEVGLLYPLEKVCRQIAVQQLCELGPEQKLFLNIHPRTISDPNFVRGETLKLIREVGLQPHNIVFEITERHSIKDYSCFNKTLEHYRSQGFLVAVDDAGSGFSCLQSIAEIRPDFIKIDMSLVRGIHGNPVKRALMETFVTFADKIHSFIIAEGIEEEDELNTIACMGVHYGQGYLLGRPCYPKAVLDEQISVKLLRWSSNARNRVWKNTFPIGDMIENAVSVNMNMPVRNVKEIFDKNELISGIVVVENGMPKGLVMRHRLYHYLSMQYGASLYFERPITSLMDCSPFILEDDTPIETVSRAAMTREQLKLYDLIIVTKNQIFKGVVSVQTILDTMTRIRLGMAKGANPLSGLPGNIAIEQQMQRHASESRPISIIFIDLDHFKSYNDKYGFESGDRVILFTSTLLSSVLRKFGGEMDFLGHIGGDDFIVITEKERDEEICVRTIKYFDRLIKSFYAEEDRREGRIFGRDREGREVWFPPISISMAVIECGQGETANLKAISEKVVQLKHFAKSIPGSVYVRDRRTRLI